MDQLRGGRGRGGGREVGGRWEDANETANNQIIDDV